MAGMGDDYEWQPPTEAEMKIIQAKRERSNRISKLMGDYLLKGYKMLGTSCPDCGTIYLQDKQKRNYCVSCNELSSDNVKDDPALNQEAARRQAAEEQQRHTPAGVGPSDLTDTAPCALPAALPTTPCLNGNPDPSNPSPREPSPGTAGCRRSLSQRAPKRSSSECSAPPQAVAGGGTSSGGMAPSYSNPSLTHQSLSMHNSLSAPTVSLQAQVNDMRGSMASLATLTGKYDVTEPLAVVSGKLTWATSELQRSGSVEASIQLCQLVKVCAEALNALHNIHCKD